MYDLDGYNVIGRKETSDRITLEVEAEPLKPLCPCSEGGKLIVHGPRKLKVRDVNVGRKPVEAHVTLKRYQCAGCKKTISQPLPHLDEVHKMTCRLIDYIEWASVERSFSAVAHETGLDRKTVEAVFKRTRSSKIADMGIDCPRRLGIDELKLGRSLYITVLIDLEEGTIVNILRDRKADSLVRCLAELREGVEVVCTDLWSGFRESVQLGLPDAKLVVDRFHVEMLGGMAVASRIASIARTDPEWKGKGVRKAVLTLKKEKVNEEMLAIRTDVFRRYPILEEMTNARVWLNEFWEMRSKHAARQALDNWLAALKPDCRKAMARIVSATKSWREEILNYFDFEPRVANARTEGMHSGIRDIFRLGKGYSFDTLRSKILLKQSYRKETRIMRPRRRSSAPIMSLCASFNSVSSEMEVDRVLNHGADISLLGDLARSGELFGD